MTDIKKESSFEIKVLGSGTSTGVPVVGCDCPICKSTNSYNKRTRSSIYLFDKKNNKKILIDTTPDLRMQLLSNDITSLDYVLFTHTHADHCHGLDDLRPLFFKQKTPIKAFATDQHKNEIKERFSYAFKETGYSGIKPQLTFLTSEELKKEFQNLDFDYASLPHGSTESTLYKFGSFIYATDFKTFPKELLQRWRNKIKLMIASGAMYKTHPSHSSIPETIKLFEKLSVPEAYITHLSHVVDHLPDSKKLPSHIKFAYDGMTLDL